jgi:hypothetical protein
MSRNRGSSLSLVVFSIGILLGAFAWADTVDPCQYGCPKSGCPQCPEGGPIKSSAKSDDACMQICKDENRAKVKWCNYPEKEPQELRECLATARNNFDACKQACGK